MEIKPMTYTLARPETQSIKQWMRNGCPLPTWIGAELVNISPDGRAWALRGQGHVKVMVWAQKEVSTQSASVGDKVQVWVNSAGMLERSETLVVNKAKGVVPPTSYTEEKALAWANFLSVIRSWFHSEGLVEVSTPSLVVCPGLEPNLDPLAVDLQLGAEVRSLFLPTSPELHLKKLLASGWTDLFEIRSCFRDDEVTPLHQPEFTMLEWYRAYTPISQLREDLLGIISCLDQKGLVIGEIGSPRTFSAKDLYREHCGIDLTPLTCLEELSQTRELTLNDALTRMWVEQVDPWLEQQKYPILVTDFHPCQAALARINNEGWADRLELYWRGLEIANGFNELNDPEEQHQRFLKDIEVRCLTGKKAVPLDSEFIEALEYGMPPAVGMALGLERLWMAAQKLNEISELKAFPMKRE